MEVARLAGEGCGGVRWGGRGVNRNGVGEVAGREKGALKHVVVWGACNFDAIDCQLALWKCRGSTLASEKQGQNGYSLPRSNSLVQIRIRINYILVRSTSDLQVRRRNLPRNAIALVIRHGSSLALYS